MTRVDHWTERAACRGIDTEIFYAHETATNATQAALAAAPAIAICRVCTVTNLCLDEALKEPGKQHGIRGGVHAKERTHMIQTARKAARGGDV